MTLALEGRALPHPAAGGRRGCSFVRQHFKMPVSRHDYGQSAIIATVQTAEDPAGRAFQRLPTEAAGPAAHAGQPLSPGVERPAGRGTGLLALDDAAFLARLQRAFWLAPRAHRGIPACATSIRWLLTVADYPWPSVPCWWATPLHLLHPSPVRGSSLGMQDLDVLARTLARALAAGKTSAALRC